MSNLEEKPQRKRRSSQAKKEPDAQRTSRHRGTKEQQATADQSADYEVTPTKPDLINPDWRSVLKSKRKSRRTTGSLSSPQELQLWLQQGGWRYIAAGAFLLVFTLIVILSLNQKTQATSPRMAPLTSVPALNNGTMSLPTVTPVPTPLPVPTAQLFVVAGTGQMGLLLRAEPTTNGQVLETLRDGMQVEQIEADFAGPSFVWRKVRSPNGKEGWVAVDWLQPAQ